MAEKTKQKTITITFVIAIILLCTTLYYFGSLDKAQAPEDPVNTEELAADIDTAEAVSERILGNPNAPIKISEHASLTCSHCAHFHNETFDKFKADYIDTGKAYLVYSDFPLNAPALQASMVARCMPKDKYFEFLGALFKTQDEWAFDRDYLNLLKGKAAQYGMNGATFQSCIDNKAIQEGIMNRMRAAQAQWEISSTPSFVVNNKTVISGAKPFEAFQAAIEAAIAPATESAAGDSDKVEQTDN